MTPDSWKEWAGALTTVGGVLLGTWRHGTHISGWFRRHWTARRTSAATRAKEQADAEKAIRVRDETIALLELRNREWERRYTEFCEDSDRDLVRKDAEIARQDRIIADLQKLLYGSRQ